MGWRCVRPRAQGFPYDRFVVFNSTFVPSESEQVEYVYDVCMLWHVCTYVHVHVCIFLKQMANLLMLILSDSKW